jgi:hypothetical protein
MGACTTMSAVQLLAGADPEEQQDDGAGRAEGHERIEPAPLPERAPDIAATQLIGSPDPEHIERDNRRQEGERTCAHGAF